MKNKYSICISARAKDRIDSFRAGNEVGRFPYKRLVHSSYLDNRPAGARRSEALSIRQRPVVVQTVIEDSSIVELLNLVDTIDIVTRHDTTDSMMVSHILGTFLDAVIMGDLVDTIAMPDPPAIDPTDREAQIDLALRASTANLTRAAKSTLGVSS